MVLNAFVAKYSSGNPHCVLNNKPFAFRRRKKTVGKNAKEAYVGCTPCSCLASTTHLLHMYTFCTPESIALFCVLKTSQGFEEVGSHFVMLEVW